MSFVVSKKMCAGVSGPEVWTGLTLAMSHPGQSWTSIVAVVATVFFFNDSLFLLVFRVGFAPQPPATASHHRCGVGPPGALFFLRAV